MFHLLKPGPVLKTEKNGTDNLLASHGLSKIYEFLLSRGHDTYLKELPDTVELYKGSDNLALAPLCTLNPLGIDFAPFKPKEIASYTMHKAPVATLPPERLGERVSTDSLRQRAKPETLVQGSGAKPKKDKKQKKDKKEKRSKRKASEEPSTATTAPSTGTSPGGVRLRIKQPRLS